MRLRLRSVVALLAIGVSIPFAGALLLAAWLLIPVASPPHPEPMGEHPRAGGIELRPDLEAQLLGDEMELYGIQTGETQVPFGQLYGGTEGFVGWRGILRTGSDPRRLRVPVHSYLIVHSRHGPILVDAGLDPRQAREGYYAFRAGGRTAFYWTHEENRLSEGPDLVASLEALGFRPDEIEHVILTHLHEDHVGALSRFPSATVHVSRIEWEDRGRVGYAPSWEGVRWWRRFDFDSGRFGGFAASKDLFDDGTVIALPAFGHTRGHAAIVVNMGEYFVLLAGDSLYTLRHLDPDALAAFNYFGTSGLETYRDTIRRILDTQQALDDLVIVPPHDPFDYTFRYLQPFLADGGIEEDEREELRAYQASLYDDAGRLRPEARPRWVSEGEGGGTVRVGIP